MAVKSYALTTAQRVADFGELGTLSGSSLTLMERIVDSVTEFIESYTNRRIKETTYTEEEYDTERSNSLILKNYPISTTADFKLERRESGLSEDDWETVDAKYYHIEYDTGIIYSATRLKFSVSRKGYRVTYTAGYSFDNSSTYLSDTEAGDLEWVVWMLCIAVYNRRKGGTGIQSEAIGDYRVVYRKTLMESEEIKDILDKYARNDTFGVLTPIQI